VDVERRIVSGFATLDNIDKQADIVTTDASVKAFSKFRGNIREMHQPTAVGKMISFKEDKYFDPESKKFYSGVYVSTYISKGAQDTWEKVLDGTLSGFSIGGKMNKEVSPMTDTTETAVEEIVEKSDDVVEEAQVAPEADAEVEKSDSLDEKGAGYDKSADEEKMEDEEKSENSEETKSEDEEAEADEVSKSDEIVDAVADIKSTLTSAFSDLAETVKSLHEQVNALTKSLDNANGELNAVKQEVAAAKGEFNEFGKRVDAVEADTAFRKSGDLGEIVQEAQSEQIEKSLWGGRFLKTADLFR
jgi:hypothetical protein